MGMTPFEDLRRRDAAAICSTYGRYPLAVSRAQGSRLYDLEGREYVDLLSGIAVTSLGHSHPEVVEAICQQARQLIHVSNLFFQEQQVLLAERLLAVSGMDDGRVFFCNSGAESNEAAIKLVRRAMVHVYGKPQAREIITLEGSFHGRTLGTVAATGQTRFRQDFDPIPGGFRHVPWNDLSAMEAAMGPTTAAVLVEAVQGEGGIRPMSREYAAGLAELCKAKGVLLMVDEVQAGLCRSGRFWAHQHYGLKPDVFTTAKALANGLPMGAMIATAELAKGFVPGVHATTFGGGGLVAAAALKVLEIMERDRLDQRAAQLGDEAQSMFRDVAAANPGKVAEIRGLGLLLGIQLALPAPACQDVWRTLLDKGFVCNLTQGNTLRLLPALTIDVADLEAFAQCLSGILAVTPLDQGA